MSLVSPLRTYSACFRFYFLWFPIILSPTPPISFPFASIRLRFYRELFYSLSASFPHPFTVPVLFYMLRTTYCAYFTSYTSDLLIFTPIHFAPLAITFYYYSDDFHIISALVRILSHNVIFRLLFIILSHHYRTYTHMYYWSHGAVYFLYMYLSVVGKTIIETHSSFPPQL